MPTAKEIAEQITVASDWNARVALIRTVPEKFGTREHAKVYAEIAREVYVPHLEADVGYVLWRDEYELEAVQSAYTEATLATRNFSSVDRPSLERAITEHPRTLRIFRLLLGLTGAEFVEACAAAAGTEGLAGKVSAGAVKAMEAGTPAKQEKVALCATAVDLGMRGLLFPALSGSRLRSKLEKPDTAEGWDSVREFARRGVPLPTFLHQRAYGGAFRQLLDATGTSALSQLNCGID
jgi:hypothetical protein